MVAVQTGSSGRKLDVNGVEVASNTLPQAANGLGACLIGGSGGVSEFFGGRIDDVRLYNRALSASEVQALFASTAPVGTLQFSAATYSVSENAGNATVTVTRTGGSAGAVSVTFTASNGTATAPGDYSVISPTAVSFADGETAKTVSISIIDDTTVEANETVNLALSTPTGGASLGSPSAAVPDHYRQ